MTEQKTKLSPARIHRIRCQGYINFTNEQVAQFAWGNRIAFILCSVLLFLGIVTANIPILIGLLSLSVLSLLLPYHPFDYIYNYWLRKPMKRPKLPPRANQLKFACAVAIAWIGLHIFLFYNGYMLAGYTSGGAMLFVTLLVSTTDFCIPSTVHNFLFKVKIERRGGNVS
jgi:hypothetical protein